MGMFALVENGAVKQWPLNETHKRNRGWPDDQARVVVAMPTPTFNDLFQYVVERKPVLIDGEPVQQWEVLFRGHEDARARGNAAMLAWINNFLRRFTETVAGAEPLAWGAKGAAARAYEDGTADDVQQIMIDAERAVTGETAAEIIAAIKAGEETYVKVISFTTGLRRKTRDALAAAEVPEMEAILADAQTAALAHADELGLT